MISSILQDYDLIVPLLPLGDLDGSSGKTRLGRGGRPGLYTDNNPFKGRNGKGKGYWGGKGYDAWTNKGKHPTKGKDKSGKGKGFGAGKQEWLPEGLRYQGASAWNHKGNKNCYGFNLGTCTDANCQKGDHSCIIFKCGGDHPVSSEVLTSDEPMASEGLDPSPSEQPTCDFDDAAGAQASHQAFSMEAEPSARISPPGNPLPSSGPLSQTSEGAPDATGPTGPTRAVLQCFAGQAQLASALIKQGYFSYGVDRVKHKSAMAPVLQMDLSSRSACDSILTWLDKQKVAGVMLCVPKHTLEPTTLAFVYAVIAGCMERDLPLVLEGASASPFWKGVEQLPAGQLPPHRVEVEWRCWSSAHSGRASVMSNMPEIVALRRDVPEPAPRTAALGASTAGLTKPLGWRRNNSLSLSEVVPEWKLVVYVLLPRSAGADPFAGAKRLKQAWPVPEDVRVLPGLKTLPADSQLLSRTQAGGSLSPQLQQEMQQLNGSWVLRVGIPWDPIEFIGQAGKLGHPFHQLSKSNKPLEELIEQLVHKPSMVSSKRKSYIERWSRRAKALEPEEAKLKAGMSQHRRKILDSKRILLFKEMLEDIRYDDIGVVQELIEGATLTGDLP
ncbi:pol, partial [Symbiodinium sp. CCMP2456]